MILSWTDNKMDNMSSRRPSPVSAEVAARAVKGSNGKRVVGGFLLLLGTTVAGILGATLTTTSQPDRPAERPKRKSSSMWRQLDDEIKSKD